MTGDVTIGLSVGVGPDTCGSCIFEDEAARLGTTTLGGNPAYPTSKHCPPDPMFEIGTLPVAFQLSSGTVSWTGTPATNDPAAR